LLKEPTEESLPHSQITSVKENMGSAAGTSWNSLVGMYDECFNILEQGN
jgi:hypothetical protein